MKHAALLITGLLTTATAFAAEVDTSKLPPAANKQGVTYEKDIRPLFEGSCFNCHGPQRAARPAGGLRLDTLELVLKGSHDGKVLVPGDSAKSAIVIAVARLDPKSAMPPPPRRGRGPGGPPPGNPPANAPGAPTQPQSMGEGDQHPPDGMNPPPGGGGQRGPQGPPPKPLTPEQVGLVRAWIDQGAK